ncbi:hypothetical protein [Azospirillum argentinense]|uniref:hypothetical protein n=1 Tax=Azospirillum argentinense TaxID=2970906 RepID=UPI0032DF03B4
MPEFWMGVAEAATVRSHSSADSCIITIGRFCPIESLGVSVAGTLALVAIAVVFGGILALVKKKAAKLTDWIGGPTIYKDDDKRG